MYKYQKILFLLAVTILFTQCKQPVQEEINLYNELKEEKNIDSLLIKYDTFKKLFPDSKFLIYKSGDKDNVGMRIYDYCLEEKSLFLWEKALPVLDYPPFMIDIEANRKVYDRLTKTKSIDGISDYIDSLRPKSRFNSVFFTLALKEVKELYDETKKYEEERWRDEDFAWANVIKLNTVDACRKYLNNHPNGKHKKEVIDIEVQLVLKGDYGSLPSMNATNGIISQKSTVKITNSTSYTLTVLYSGPSSERVIISTGKSEFVKLKSGTYRISASVDNYRVRNFAGTEVINMADYDIEYYIETSRY